MQLLLLVEIMGVRENGSLSHPSSSGLAILYEPMHIYVEGESKTFCCAPPVRSEMNLRIIFIIKFVIDHFACWWNRRMCAVGHGCLASGTEEQANAIENASVAM